MRIDKDNIKIILILLVVCLGIGYSYLNTELNINGTANINSANWSVYWNNVQVESGSVTAPTPTIDSDKTTVSYTVTLAQPGDYYEFTVDAVNAGTIDAMIETIDSKLNGVTMEEVPAYLDYGISYADNIPLEENQELLHDSTETYKVHIGYADYIEADELPDENQSLSLQLTVTYKQADDDAVPVPHSVSFAEDDWSTIVAAVKSGNTSNYNVGDTKEVDMGSLGTHTLRIANMSEPEECDDPDFSETACGFVLEFADIITKHRMNPDYNNGTSGTGNVGGWPASEMRTYVNSDIYNALPEELRNGIINTTVVSGHGSEDSANFTSTDKLYLLDAKEIYGDSFTNQYNTAKDSERQLDYYSSQNVTTSSYAGAIKKNNGSDFYLWLRSADSTYTSNFNIVHYYGYWSNATSDYTYGVSPAFRIG
jgi:hypothetical protein